MVITTTGETDNEREYLNATGTSFKLSDDTESGTVRTTAMFTGEKYEPLSCDASLESAFRNAVTYIGSIPPVR